MRVYRALLRLYPASFRTEYADEMCAVFARHRHAAAGPAALAGLWLGALADTLANAARVHMDLLRQDLRFAARMLRRTPGFALTAVVVVALGIGATTAAFAVADHVLLRPLPFPDPGRLVKLWEDQSFRGYSRMELSPPTYDDWRRQSRSFESMAAYVASPGNMVGVGTPVRLEGARVGVDLFRTLGVGAVLGRALTAEDGRGDALRAVVLSDDAWRTVFAGDRGVLGRTVVIDGRPCTVVGVMPRGFAFPTRDTQFWTALRFEPDELGDRNNNFLRVVARLKDGVSIDQARAELHVIAARLARQYPEDANTSATVVGLRDEVSQQPRLLLAALVAASACLLLIACTNLANLMLARALARRKEMAIRAALGAGLDRLLRQMLTESLVLAAVGGSLGLLLAIAAVPLVARLVPTVLPITGTPPVDARLLTFAVLLSVLTGLAFGAVPALRACRAPGVDGLREGARSGPGRHTERVRGVLVVAQVAASVVLIVAAGLLARALLRVESVDPGFHAGNVLTLRTTLPLPRYQATARRAGFYRSVLDEIRALPGVRGAAYTSFLPMTMRGGIWPVTVDGRPEDPGAPSTASLRLVTPGFFATLGIPLVHGRDVTPADTLEAPPVAVVSESFVREHWPGQDPIGRIMNIGLRDRTVVGVVGNVRVRGLERESEPQVYMPAGQVPDGGLVFYIPQDLAISLATDAGIVLPAVRRVIAKADPDLPISNVRMLSDIVDLDTAPRAMQVRVLGTFAALAFALAAVGLHGLLAFSVSTRAREIGVRMALGATAGSVLRMVLGQALVLAAVGTAAGAALALAAGRSMQSLLAGVSPWDTPTFTAAAALMLGMTLAGALTPAIRAVRIDPVAAIRSDE